jgi:hydrogenase large subunit
MNKRIVIDPVTRIEGHLRIEAVVENGVVTDAYSAGTMVRGLEKILQGRDPRDAWAFAERVCGVCTTVHALASCRSVEDALGITVPRNADLVRNLMCCATLVQDHVVHFYHLHALDWVDVVSLLKADPMETSRIAQSLSPWPKSNPGHFAAVQQRIRKFVESGQLGIFANGYWGHKAYKLPPEVNLMAVSHYLDALEWQKEMVKVHAIFGGKNPHPNYLVGGVPCSFNTEEVNAINSERLNHVGSLIKDAIAFVEQVYIPDLLAVAGYYKDWAAIGGGLDNYLAYGDLPTRGYGDPASFLLPRGAILGRNLSEVHEVNGKEEQEIKEYISHSWYRYEGGDGVGLHPFKGETEFNFTGPKPPYEQLEVDGKYSWLKTPRWKEHPMEVGPLARMLVAYAKGNPDVKELVGTVLGKLDVPVTALFSTLGRTAARGVETQVVAHWMKGFYDDLIANIKNGEVRTHTSYHWDPETWPAEAQGVGMTEAPRGALAHWIRIKDRTIDNYQMVVPSTWNASPRDPRGQRSSYESALIGTPVADPDKPVEILRTIHSFDPCLACAVHLYDPDGTQVGQVQIG